MIQAQLIERAGWYLPKTDTYFAQFFPGPAPKRNGFMREHLHEALKYVKKWDIAIDVGAHVGFWSWDMAQQFKRVYSFEPAPDTYDCLVKNVAEMGNVTTAQIAIGDRSGKVIINDDDRPKHKDPKGNTGSRWVMPIKEDAEGVPMIPLDSLNFEALDFLKIDVEGFELQVLQGARELIAQFRPVICMECDKRFEDRYGVKRGSAEQFLKAAGYHEVAHMRPDKVFACV